MSLERLDQFLGRWLLEEVEHSLLDDSSSVKLCLDHVGWVLLVLSLESGDDSGKSLEVFSFVEDSSVLLVLGLESWGSLALWCLEECLLGCSHLGVDILVDLLVVGALLEGALVRDKLWMVMTDNESSTVVLWHLLLSDDDLWVLHNDLLAAWLGDDLSWLGSILGDDLLGDWFLALSLNDLVDLLQTTILCDLLLDNLLLLDDLLLHLSNVISVLLGNSLKMSDPLGDLGPLGYISSRFDDGLILDDFILDLNSLSGVRVNLLLIVGDLV